MDQESVSALALLWRALLTTAKLLGLAYVAMWVVWGFVAVLMVVIFGVTGVVVMLASVVVNVVKWWGDR